MNRDPELPPPLEMVCLTALWRIGEGNVEDVRSAIAGRTLAYTTVLTLLDRLTRRGAVVRRKEGRAFRYRPSVERDVIRRRALTVFLACHFDGSAADLQTFLQNSPQPQGDQPPAESAAAATTA
jgi:predicted transcriptional regulator